MSDSVSSATDTAAVGTNSPVDSNMLDTFFTAMHKGASLVYHKILQIEQNVVAWETSHAEVGPLIQEAVTYGSNFLHAYGIPIPSLEIASNAVLATLKDMASTDSSVPSMPAPVAVTATLSASTVQEAVAKAAELGAGASPSVLGAAS